MTASDLKAKKVLVVDDSALMRKYLRKIFEKHECEVSIARNGEDALTKLEDEKPDVVTLDINMPVMDGLTCLKRLMKERPTPVVMVSSLTESGAKATFDALAFGAVDFVTKPGGTVSLNLQKVEEELVSKVRVALRARIGRARGLSDRVRRQRNRMLSDTRGDSPSPESSIRLTPPKVEKQLLEKSGCADLVVVGVSTGGPSALETLIQSLAPEFTSPLVVAQHMPARFTSVFASRLDRQFERRVVEVDRTMQLEPKTVYIAKGDADVRVLKRRGKLVVSTVSADDSRLWHPSVERLVESVGECCDPERVICVMLTGMGSDGAERMAELNAKGARTIAEAEETAVVYGMPKELVDKGGADRVLPVDMIGSQLNEWLS